MSTTSAPLTVMVTGVGGGGHGEQILKALRLSSLDLRIIGGDMSPMSRGLQFVDSAYILPAASDPSYLDAVLKVVRKENVQALLHGSEPELKVHSAQREFLRQAGLFLPINSADVINLCMDKVRTCEVLAAHGFAVPEYRKVQSVADATEFPCLPAVLKPSVGGGGSANIYLAQHREELRIFSAHLLDLYKEFIIQEYVGTADQEYTVGVLCDLDGHFINSIAVKRYILSALSNRIKVPNRTGLREYGDLLAVSSGVSQGEIGRFPEVTGPCEKIALALGSRGPLNIQCRFFRGKVYVMEINPRFSGTTSLRAMAGFNEPEVLIRKHLLHENIAVRFPYREGAVMRGLDETFIDKMSFALAKDVA